MVATLVITPALQLESDMATKRFRTELVFSGPFLPINPTLACIIQFMSMVAQFEFHEIIQPRTFSSTRYPQVDITINPSSEAHFLLRGIYNAAVDMVSFSRFNNVVVKLFWDNSPVGQISILANTGMGFLSPTLNDAGSVMDDGGGLSLEDVSNKTTQAFVERLNTPPVGNVTGIAAIENTSMVDSVKALDKTSGSPSTSPGRLPPKAPLTPELAINFDRIVGSTQLDRNDVFLTFYAAILHVAKFSVGRRMQHFDIGSPATDLDVHMYEIGTGCSVTLLALLMPTYTVNMMKQC